MRKPDACFLAVDLGAASGRAVLGVLRDGLLQTREIHRFPNLPVEMNGVLYWDLPALFREVNEGIRQTLAAADGRLAGIGVDTWGVDFGLLNESGRLSGNPVHYRDRRNLGAMERVFELMPPEEIFRRTGIQFLPFNTLFQLAAMKNAAWPELAAARTLLLMPDLFNYLLCGEKKSEFTIASTTQMLNAATGEWDRGLLEAVGLPTGLLTEIRRPGTVLGELRTGPPGAPAVPVIATAGHDTAAAVAAVPAEPATPPGVWAYISSGTWSLMGVELKAPLITPSALRYNFTNEGGTGGTFRFLKNLSGLWAVQECRRIWSREEGREQSYAELTRLAENASPFLCFIDPDHPSFLLPENMPQAVLEFCRRTGQPLPGDKGQMIRCILESLALKYRGVKAALERMTGLRITMVHIVGGGSQDELLNQFSADALAVPVVAGPVEATAVGNLLVQLLAAGVIPDLAAGRALVRNSFPLTCFEPRDPGRWDEAEQRFQKILALAGGVD